MAAERGPKAIRSSRVCYDCAMPIVGAISVCPRCHGTDIDNRRSRPKNHGPRGFVDLPHPMTNLRMKKGGTMLLSGGPGSGKSTICVAARPKIISSSEQENEEVAAIWYRVHGDDLPCPIISTCLDWEELEEDLLQLSEGELGIVDSISQLASGPESSKILSRAVRNIREKGALAIFITQYTKEGDMLGPNELRHMVDVVASIPDDPGGLRRLAVQKNRFGPIFSQYFSIGEHGVKDQNFPWAYSVEGPPGRYSLHLYPMGGAKWSGILDAFSKAGVQVSGVASAALLSPIYRTGFVEPDDVEWRMKFAADHGLSWVNPEKAVEMILEQARSEEDG